MLERIDSAADYRKEYRVMGGRCHAWEGSFRRHVACCCLPNQPSVLMTPG